MDINQRILTTIDVGKVNYQKQGRIIEAIMDFIDVIKDNSQALFTLSGVLLGSAITFLGNYLNARIQAKENDKGRLEKRREAKIQLAMELTKNDIAHIETSTKHVFAFLDQVKVLNLKRDISNLTQEEWWSEFRSMITNEQSAFSKLLEADPMTDVLVYVQGSEIYSMYNNFTQVFDDYLHILSNPSATDVEKEEGSEKVTIACAKLQQALRDKLISIMDIE